MEELLPLGSLQDALQVKIFILPNYSTGNHKTCWVNVEQCLMMLANVQLAFYAYWHRLVDVAAHRLTNVIALDNSHTTVYCTFLFKVIQHTLNLLTITHDIGLHWILNEVSRDNFKYSMSPVFSKVNLKKILN